MKTDGQLCEALKTMMNEKPLDEISVLSLTKKCKIQRQSFYYHFHDIYDLLSLVYLNEEIDGIYTCKTITEMVTKIYKYYDKNRGFIDATLDSAGKDLFLEFLYNNCFITLLKIISYNVFSNKVSSNNKKNIARFYASAYSNTIAYYLSTSRTKSLDGMLGMFGFVGDSDLNKALHSLYDKEKEN